MNNDNETEPEASQPVIYESQFTVTVADIDGLGHVNNVVYLRWVQDVATAHWLHSSTPEQQKKYGWVAIRHEIDYLTAGMLGDDLIARTYVGSVTGIKFERFVEIVRPSDGRTLAKSRSIWAPIDMITKRPCRIDPAINQQFLQPPPG